MLYTGKGDKCQTSLYACNQRLSKSSQIAEALGAVDEINSLLGWCKTKAEASQIVISKKKLPLILEETQNSLFSIQAELAGAPKKLSKTAISKTESIIKLIEAEIPPIKNFVIPGGTELSAMLDVARTVARRAERQVVAVAETGDTLRPNSGQIKLSANTLAFLNRLSSLLYALARLVNHRAGVKDNKPTYK